MFEEGLSDAVSIIATVEQLIQEGAGNTQNIVTWTIKLWKGSAYYIASNLQFTATIYLTVSTCQCNIKICTIKTTTIHKYGYTLFEN